MYAIRSYYAVVLFTTLEKEEDGEKKIETNEEVINSQQAIWLRITSYNVCYTKLLRLS